MFHRFVCAAALCGIFAASAFAERITEKHDNGKVRLTFTQTPDGVKQGSYTEFWPSGQRKISARYKDGKLSGRYFEWDENGKPLRKSVYRDGELHGLDQRYEAGKLSYKAEFKMGVLHGQEVAYEDGRAVQERFWYGGEMLLYDRSKSQIDATLKAIAKADIEGPGDAQEKDALRRLMQYRYLCGVPHEGMTLDEQMNLEAKKAAEVCEKLGFLTHGPEKNPGMSDADFALAKRGAAKSNLAAGSGGLSRAIDMWMDDSDPSNIDRLGHRRWCLNPPMLKAGLGNVGRSSALWCMDKSRSEVPEWDMIAYPVRGFMPAAFFGQRHAWSLALNPRQWEAPGSGAVKVSVWSVEGKQGLDRERITAGEPLKLDYFRVSNDGFGVRNAIIFRPEQAPVSPGRRYWVRVEGVKAKTAQADKRRRSAKAAAAEMIEYLVEFY